MFANFSLPWMQINDFLLEIGGAEDEKDFVRRVIQNVNTLVPIDEQCVFALVDVKGAICRDHTFIDNQKQFDAFCNRYWNMIPDVSAEDGEYVKRVDWNRYHHTEYVADFMNPLHIQYSIGIPIYGRKTGYAGTLAVNRSAFSVRFSERDMAVMEAVQPHLSNLYQIFFRSRTAAPVPDASDLASTYQVLTRRESEIVAFLFQGYDTEMIASKLFISPLTVYKHLENIFRKLEVASRNELIAKILRENGCIADSSNP